VLFSGGRPPTYVRKKKEEGNTLSSLWRSSHREGKSIAAGQSGRRRSLFFLYGGEGGGRRTYPCGPRLPRKPRGVWGPFYEGEGEKKSSDFFFRGKKEIYLMIGRKRGGDEIVDNIDAFAKERGGYLFATPGSLAIFRLVAKGEARVRNLRRRTLHGGGGEGGKRKPSTSGGERIPFWERGLFGAQKVLITAPKGRREVRGPDPSSAEGAVSSPGGKEKDSV